MEASKKEVLNDFCAKLLAHTIFICSDGIRQLHRGRKAYVRVSHPYPRAKREQLYVLSCSPIDIDLLIVLYKAT
jgi:hypothetical protein